MSDERQPDERQPDGLRPDELQPDEPQPDEPQPGERRPDERQLDAPGPGNPRPHPPAPPRSEPPPGAWPGPWPASPPVAASPGPWPPVPPPGGSGWSGSADGSDGSGWSAGTGGTGQDGAPWGSPGPGPAAPGPGSVPGSVPGSPRRRLVYGGAAVAAVLLIAALAASTIDDRSSVVGGPAVPGGGAGAPTLVECTPAERMPDLGGGHLDATVDALSLQPPSALYPDQPPTSGGHLGQVVASGAYEARIDPRLTTHNLEHGYMVAWYDEDAPTATIAALLSWGAAAVEAGAKVVVAGYPDVFDDGVDVALTAWRWRQLCDGFDDAAARAFLRDHLDTAGEAPEAGIPAHLPGDAGVVDPAGRDVLLPPLEE